MSTSSYLCNGALFLSMPLVGHADPIPAGSHERLKTQYPYIFDDTPVANLSVLSHRNTSVLRECLF